LLEGRARRLSFVMYPDAMIRRVPLVAMCAALSLACRAAPPLANTLENPEAVGRALLDALAQRDRRRLDALALNEREFRDHVWPDLPAARPERNLPFSYVWGDLHQKSRLALSDVIEQYGGKRFELRRVRFLGKSTQYAHSTVHRASVFDAVDASGNEVALRLCGSLIQKDDGWKVFSYVVDD
jgi:hypothetical protein